MTRQEKCSADGKDNSKNKTPPRKNRGRNEENCGDGRDIVAVAIVVEPVVVPVPPVAVPVEVTNVDVAVSVAVSHRMPSVPLPLEYSWSCIVFGIVMP